MGTKSKFHVDIMCLNEEVTGSCHLCVVKFPDGATVKFIVDCGLFQEEQYSKYNESFPFNPDELAFAAVTHNHTDHIGRLPLLAKFGFDSPIFATELTKGFMRESLQDTCRILNQVAKRSHTKPLYTTADFEKTLKLTKGVNYLTEIVAYEDNSYMEPKKITLTFLDNGHLPGASMILIKIACQEEEDINLLFTGDYSNHSTFFDVQPFPKSVFDLPLTIIQEATYADTKSDTIEYVFEKNIVKALQEGKTIIVPVFSLGRSQELMLKIKNMQDEGKIDRDIPVYLDGKLSMRYTNIYLRNAELFKESTQQFLPANFNFVDKKFRANLIIDPSPKIILTSSGMGSYGPAPFYISNYVSSKNALIHFVGYPAAGTLSRRLKDAEDGDFVKIGSVIKKKFCDIEYTTEFSSHAKLDEILDFLKQFNDIKLILVNHGEYDCKENLAEKIVDYNIAKDVAIESRATFYRIGRYGLLKELTTKFL
jgi:metallo-beta-lactamase family protein